MVINLKKKFFKIAKISQVIEQESLSSLINRYRLSKEKITEVKKLFYGAPPFFKKIHNFKEKNSDIIFDYCWTFIRAVNLKKT